MKQILLHIGRHKTGTSSIQYFLANNPDFLAANGCYYLKLNRGSKIANHDLAHALNPKFTDRESMRRVKQQFDAEVGQAREEKIVISSEGFPNVRDYSFLEEFFSGYHLTVLCYLRETLVYKQSAYSQLVHATGYYGRFSDYTSTFKLNFRDFVDKWNQVADKLILCLYQRTRLERGDIVADFIARSGLGSVCASTKLEAIHNNPSIGGNLLYFKLLYNLAVEGEYKPREHYRLLQTIAGEDSRYRTNFRISAQDAADIRKFDSASNSFLEKRFDGIEYKDFENFPSLPDRAHLVEDFEFFRAFEEFRKLPPALELLNPSTLTVRPASGTIVSG